MRDARTVVGCGAIHHRRGPCLGAALVAAAGALACERPVALPDNVDQTSIVDDQPARYLAVTNAGRDPLASIEVAWALQWQGDDRGAPVVGLVGPELYQRSFVQVVKGAAVPVSAHAPLAPGATAYGALLRLSPVHTGIYSDGGSGNETPPPPPPPPPRLDVLGLRVGHVAAAALDGKAPGSTAAAPEGSVQVAVLDGDSWPLASRDYDDSAAGWPLLRAARAVGWQGGNNPDLSTGSGGWLWLASPQAATLSRVDPRSGQVDRRVPLKVFAGPIAGYVSSLSGNDIAVDGKELVAAAGSRLTRYDLDSGLSTTVADVAGVSSLGGVAPGLAGLLAIGDGALGALTDKGGARFTPWYQLPAGERGNRLGRMAGYLATTSPSAGRVQLRDPVTGTLVASYPIGGLAEGPCGADASGAWLFVDDCEARSTLVFDLISAR